MFFVSREDEWALGGKALAFQQVATYVATFIDKILKRRLRCVWHETTSCSYFRETGAFLAHHQLLKSCGRQTTPSQPLPISGLNTRPNQWTPVGRHSSPRVDLGEPPRSALGPSPRIQFPLCQDPWCALSFSITLVPLALKSSIRAVPGLGTYLSKQLIEDNISG